MVLIENLFVVNGKAYKILYEKYYHATDKEKCSFCSKKNSKIIIKLEKIFDYFIENEINLSSLKGQKIAKDFSRMFPNICTNCVNQKDERRG